MKKILFIGLIVFGLFQLQNGQFNEWFDEPTAVVHSEISTQQQELQKTLARIRNNGPYPYDRDGITFENREKLLPIKPQGYYREFTVDTPGLSHRGPRRVVTGGYPPEVFYYTEDHYRSFTKIQGR